MLRDVFGEMGNLFSSSANVRVQRRQAERNKERQNIIKILLLGCGESGKTTIVRSLQFIYSNDLTRQEKLQKKLSIFANLLEGTQAVIEACTLLSNIIEDPKSVQAAQLIMDSTVDYTNIQRLKFSKDQVDAILLLNSDANFIASLKHSNEFLVPESYAYFVDQLKKYPQWGSQTEQWIPSHEDILRVRVRTTGVYTTDFMIKDRKFEVTDVGGQLSERSRWLPLFKGIHAMVYVASLVDYRLKLFEDNKTNRLVDSVEQWCKICKHINTPGSALEKTTIILFLNKVDLLFAHMKETDFEFDMTKEVLQELGQAPKLPHLDKSKQSEDEMMEVVCGWFKALYLKRFKTIHDAAQSEGHKSEDGAHAEVFTFVTSALDEQQMDKVMFAIRAQILMQMIN